MRLFTSSTVRLATVLVLLLVAIFPLKAGASGEAPGQLALGLSLFTAAVVLSLLDRFK